MGYPIKSREMIWPAWGLVSAAGGVSMVGDWHNVQETNFRCTFNYRLPTSDWLYIWAWIKLTSDEQSITDLCFYPVILYIKSDVIGCMMRHHGLDIPVFSQRVRMTISISVLSLHFWGLKRNKVSPSCALPHKSTVVTLWGFVISFSPFFLHLGTK